IPRFEGEVFRLGTAMIFPAFSKIVSRIGYPDLSFPLPEMTGPPAARSEEHTSELQSLMRISYAVFCLKKKINNTYALDATVSSTTTTTIQLHTQLEFVS